MLHKSTNDLFQKNPDINKNEINAVLVSTNNNSKYLSASIIGNGRNSAKNCTFN